MKINVITLFSGYDLQCLALESLKERHPDFDYDLVAWCEIDKFAIMAHDLIFPQWSGRNIGDIEKVDWSMFSGVDVDLITYSSPCTDISFSGKLSGIREGSGTSSSLLWNVYDAIDVIRPRFLLQENVRSLVSRKFLPYFTMWRNRIEGLGYRNYWKVMDSSDYGIPQHRERLFMVSVRSDVDLEFSFPDKKSLGMSVSDIVEPSVDDSFFLSDEQVWQLIIDSRDFRSFHDFSNKMNNETATI